METLALTAGIVASFVEKNRVSISELPQLIESVHRALARLGSPAEEAVDAKTVRATPAQVRRSITPEGLISFEDGKPYKVLKRHLNTVGLTPAEYREKWGLPPDYPMTAPAYAEKRSALAKSSGLGRGARRGSGRKA